MTTENSVLVECCGCGTIEVLKNTETRDGWEELEPATDMGVSHIGYCPDCLPSADEQRGVEPVYEVDGRELDAEQDEAWRYPTAMEVNPLLP